MENVLMQCGCRAQGKSKGKPVCVVHLGLDPRAELIAETPKLEGRTAHCCYGTHGTVPSSLKLPFFEYRPESPQDRYYCGCHGWD